MKIFNRPVGLVNEAKAVKYIKKFKKLKVLEQNYSNKLGEIDIIAKSKDGTIVFIEVKYRSSAKYGFGREAVDERKQFKIKSTATKYLQELRLLDAKVRFDVIDILDQEISYIENAF